MHHEVYRLPLCLCPELRVPLADPWQASPSAHEGHHVAWSPEGNSVRGRQGKAVWSPGGRGFPDSGLGPGWPFPLRPRAGHRRELALGDKDGSRVASAWPWHISALLSWIPRTAQPLRSPWRGRGLGGVGWSGRGGSLGLCRCYERRDPGRPGLAPGGWRGLTALSPGFSLCPTLSCGADTRRL